jgi:hypothetical protein
MFFKLLIGEDLVSEAKRRTSADVSQRVCCAPRSEMWVSHALTFSSLRLDFACNLNDLQASLTPGTVALG